MARYSGKKGGANKEVAKGPGHGRGSTEESFGGAPGKIAVGGGEMCTFGHKIHPGVWPPNTVSPDVKTGFPKGYDQGTKGPKP